MLGIQASLKFHTVPKGIWRETTLINLNNDISAVLPANKVVEKDSEQQLATPAIPIHPLPVISCIIQNRTPENPIPGNKNPNVINNNKNC